MTLRRSIIDKETQFPETRHTLRIRDQYTQAPDTAEIANNTLQADREELCSDYIFDPMIRQTVNINSSFRKRRRKEEFDALKFLVEKKREQDYYFLEFLPEDDIQDELAVINSSPDKKRTNLLADGVLRKIAEHLENLNKIFNYRMLDIQYEKH